MTSYSEFLRKVGYTGKYKGISPHKAPVLKVQENAPLSNSIPGNGAKKEVKKYTGDEIVGIGTMHKSNAVPITRSNPDGPKDLANMRKGEC